MSIAKQMINGELCGCCGCYIKGEAQGFPRYCNSCKTPAPQKTKTKTKCTICGVKVVGLNDHIRAKHTGEQK